ncbi:MAG: hypothetical protein ORN28_11960 [Rhodoferax sp.]|nr:hypothetical protein [Rhodoferax sp.]
MFPDHAERRGIGWPLHADMQSAACAADFLQQVADRRCCVLGCLALTGAAFSAFSALRAMDLLKAYWGICRLT